MSVINGGVRSNIIPEDVTMLGTIRTLDTGMQRIIHEKIALTASKIAEASGATAETSIDKNACNLQRPRPDQKMVPSFIKAAGEENVIETEAVTGAEDFSFFAEKVPSIFFFIGGMEKGKDPKKAFPHHTPILYWMKAG